MFSIVVLLVSCYSVLSCTTDASVSLKQQTVMFKHELAIFSF